MKMLPIKILSVLFALFIVLCSCQNTPIEYTTNSEWYEVLDISSLYDTPMAVKRPVEYDLYDSKNVNDSENLKGITKTFRIAGIEESGKYTGTTVFEEYEAEIDMYGLSVGVKKDTGEVVYYYNKNAERSQNEKNKEVCLLLAKDLLRKYVWDISEYKITEQLVSDNVGEAYEFTFERDYKNVKSRDYAIVQIATDGTLLFLDARTFGILNGVPEPDEEVLSIITNKVDEKVREVYSVLDDKCEIDYTIENIELTRLKNAKLALSYKLDVNLTAKGEDALSDYHDPNRYIVFLE